MSSASGSSLMPQHSTDLAAELSAHLNSALASDKSYSQMNDAKMRGIQNSAGGWEQFHGMVLTAHLQPVNLRTDPIDEMAKGVARNKKIEASKSRLAQSYARDFMIDGGGGGGNGSGASAEEQRASAEFMQSMELATPTNAHEFARDWKRIATAADTPALVSERRYRYLLSLPQTSFSSLLKGGIPLEVVAGIIETVHSQWVPATPTAAAAAVDGGDATAAAESAAPSASASASATPSPPSPFEILHVTLLLHSLTSMASFAISVFALTSADRTRVGALLALVEAETQKEAYVEWSEARKSAAAAAAANVAASSSSTTAAAAPSSSAPSAAPTASSASYPMLLPGWPAGVGESSAPSPAGSASSSHQLARGPLRDDASTNVSMRTVSAPAVDAKKPTVQLLDITPALLVQLRTKFKAI